MTQYEGLPGHGKEPHLLGVFGEGERAVNAEVTNDCEEFEQKMDSQIEAKPNPLVLISGRS